ERGGRSQLAGSCPLTLLRVAFRIPLAGEAFQLCQDLLNVAHAICDAVGDSGRNRRFVMAEDEACVLESAQSLGKDARRNSFDISLQDSKTQGTVGAERPQDVHGPRAGEQFQKAADGARGSDLLVASHVYPPNTKLLQSAYYLNRS